MKWLDLKDKSKEELEKERMTMQTLLVEFKFQVKAGSLKQVHRVSETKKTIARINTRLQQLQDEAITHQSHA